MHWINNRASAWAVCVHEHIFCWTMACVPSSHIKLELEKAGTPTDFILTSPHIHSAARKLLKQLQKTSCFLSQFSYQAALWYLKLIWANMGKAAAALEGKNLELKVFQSSQRQEKVEFEFPAERREVEITGVFAFLTFCVRRTAVWHTDSQASAVTEPQGEGFIQAESLAPPFI